MKKQLKQLTALVITLILSIFVIGVDCSDAASKNYKSTIYVYNPTDVTATITAKLKSTGNSKSIKIKPKTTGAIYINSSKKSDKVYVTFTNGLLGGNKAPTKSFNKTVTVKSGKSYTLSPKTKTKTYTSVMGLSYAGNLNVKYKYVYAYKF